ncbi:hypothetical protein SCAR479_07560 [Seiridium cardinale]|uniref:BTB domain-containing protein n=1 Tax=Seiridium cardinale TaxID=138064 RepID=A0ABR2XPL2_9PEZI
MNFAESMVDSTGHVEEQRSDAKNRTRNQKKKAQKRRAMRETLERRSSEDKVLVRIMGRSGWYHEKYHSREILVALSDKFKHVLSDGRKLLQMSLDDHEEWDVVLEALRYIDEPAGLSPGWKVDGTANEHDAATKSEHFLEHLVKLARLYLIAKTMGTWKLMRAALTEIHCAIRLVRQCFSNFILGVKGRWSLEFIRPWVEYSHSYFAGTAYIIYQAVGCIDTNCGCATEDSIQFTALGGVKEQKHCGYESNEPWEITGGRRVIFKLVDTFERALSPLSSPDRPFKFEKPEAIWRKALTPDTKFPKHAQISSDADNGSVSTSIRDNHIRQIWSAASQAPVAIGHCFDKEYYHYNSESPLSSTEREEDRESSTTSTTTVASA